MKKRLYFVVVIPSVVLFLYFFVPMGTGLFDVFSLYELQSMSMSNDSILVIKPLLTANAYRINGFYDYYNGTCDESCLNITIDESKRYGFTSSLSAIELFKRLDADMIDDYRLSRTPELIFDYDKIVVLHNEYVTQEIFDALQRHDDVYYMYPNALYGVVELNGDTMTLIKGHGYQGIANGFGWKNENTHPYEYDVVCKQFEWYVIDNGYMLNCYPEFALLDNKRILDKIRE